MESKNITVHFLQCKQFGNLNLGERGRGVERGQETQRLFQEAEKCTEIKRDERSLNYRIGKGGTTSYRPNLDPTEVHDCFASDFNGTRLSANRRTLNPHNRSVR